MTLFRGIESSFIMSMTAYIPLHNNITLPTHLFTQVQGLHPRTTAIAFQSQFNHIFIDSDLLLILR